MKTLKYLVLLLVVAVALPAAAQIELLAAQTEKVSVKDFTGGKEAFIQKDKGNQFLKASDATPVRVGKFTGQVQVVNGVLEASLVSPKGYTLELRKGSDGKVRRFCTGDEKYCKGMPNFEYAKDEAEQEMADVQDEIPWDAYSEEESEEEAWAEEAVEVWR